MKKLFLVLVSITAVIAQALGADPLFTIWPSHANGVYTLNEKVSWTVDVQGDRSKLTAVAYAVRRDGQDPIEQGTLDLSNGPAKITASLDQPACLLAVLSSPDKSITKPLALGGAVVAPEKIGPAVPAPEDFDAFWQEKLKELSAVPINPVVEKIAIDQIKEAAGIDYYKVILDNIHGTHVQGQLTRPTTGNKFPAILILQWAGVYPLEKIWAINPAKEGFLVLNIEAHDIAIDESPTFYENLKEGALKDYYYKGYEDRDTCYFLRMLLGCVRAAEYLATRPDWDGTTLIVTGTSQGGLQSFATAALFPKISHLMVQVPAGCDISGQMAQPPRALGWPYWISNWKPREIDMTKVQKTAGYFDAIHFAARVRCPSLIAPGLIDETARPTGIIAAYNAVQNPDKELLILPLSNHQGNNNTQLPYRSRSAAWRQEIKNGKLTPHTALTAQP